MAYDVLAMIYSRNRLLAMILTIAISISYIITCYMNVYENLRFVVKTVEIWMKVGRVIKGSQVNIQHVETSAELLAMATRNDCHIILYELSLESVCTLENNSENCRELQVKYSAC